jgi:steroid 5-alpha reductase family enzyme
MLEEKCGAFYPFVNLLGIHLVPTLVVYLCTLPVAYALEFSVEGNVLSYVALVLSVVGIALEGVADVEMHIYRKTKTTPFIRQGLWKNARHPNYLGEILMWWGIGVSLLCATSLFWMPIGAIVNTALFLFISIPMADKRQAKKEGFVEYKAKTRSLFPFPKK